MKRLFIFLITLLMVLSIAACSNKETTGSNPQGSEKAGQEEQTEQPKTSGKVDGKRTVWESFAAFKDARDRFDNYVQNQNNEIVNVGWPTVAVFDLNIFDYVLPLDFMGRSVELSGKFNAETETQMLRQAWADDAQLTYDEATGYLLKGTGSKGNVLEIKVKFDEKADSLRLEAYKDGALDLIFEYVAIDGGYAAQYYLEAATRYEKFTPVMGLCNHKLIFSGNNGSRARYDNVASEPESILGSTPDLESFVDGATHWFTIKNGQLSGNIDGKAF